MIFNNLKYLAYKIGYSSKPDFIIIGAQKAGTTALFNILNQHRLIVGSKKKETHFFDNDEKYSKNAISEYHAHFPFPHEISNSVKLFEATPAYLYHPLVAERLYKYNRNLKFIVMLRNPAFRALSAWTMYNHNDAAVISQLKAEPVSFHNVINNDIKDIISDTYYTNPKGIVKRGLYQYQIENYLKLFNKNQILFIEDSQFKTDFENSIRNILNFIEVPFEKIAIEFSNVSLTENKDLYKVEIEILKDFYKPYNHKLFNLLGMDYGWNS